MQKLLLFMVPILICSLSFIACENSDSYTFDSDKDSSNETEAKFPLENDSELDLQEKDIVDIEKTEVEQEKDTDDPVKPDGDIDIQEIDKETITEYEPEIEPDFELEIEPDLEFEIEQELEPDKEKETQIKVTVKDFPFKDTKILDCPSNGSRNREFPKVNSIWQDSNGTTYFGTYSGFWVYNPVLNILGCMPEIKENVTTVSGREENNVVEIWIGLKNRIGRLNSGSWTFYELPDPPSGLENDKDLHAVSISVDVKTNHLVASYTKLPSSGKPPLYLGLFSIADQKWTAIDACADMRYDLNTKGYWIDKTFYMSGGNHLYSLKPDSFTCNTVSILGNDSSKNNRFRVFGKENKKFWISEHFPESSNEKYHQMKTVSTFDTQTKQVNLINQLSESDRYYAPHNVIGNPLFTYRYELPKNNGYTCSNSIDLYYFLDSKISSANYNLIKQNTAGGPGSSCYVYMGIPVYTNMVDSVLLSDNIMNGNTIWTTLGSKVRHISWTETTRQVL